MLRSCAYGEKLPTGDQFLGYQDKGINEIASPGASQRIVFLRGGVKNTQAGLMGQSSRLGNAE
jgi:hypothetical protein